MLSDGQLKALRAMADSEGWAADDLMREALDRIAVQAEALRQCQQRERQAQAEIETIKGIVGHPGTDTGLAWECPISEVVRYCYMRWLETTHTAEQRTISVEIERDNLASQLAQAQAECAAMRDGIERVAFAARNYLDNKDIDREMLLCMAVDLAVIRASSTAGKAEAAGWHDTARWLWRHANGYHFVPESDDSVELYNDELSHTAEMMTDPTPTAGQALLDRLERLEAVSKGVAPFVADQCNDCLVPEMDGPPSANRCKGCHSWALRAALLAAGYCTEDGNGQIAALAALSATAPREEASDGVD